MESSPPTACTNAVVGPVCVQGVSRSATTESSPPTSCTNAVVGPVCVQGVSRSATTGSSPPTSCTSGPVKSQITAIAPLFKMAPKFGCEMCFAPSTDRRLGKNKKKSRIQEKKHCTPISFMKGIIFKTPISFMMGFQAILDPTSNYDGEDNLLFSPCSQERISKVLYSRRRAGKCFQGNLGVCKGVDCTKGNACSAAYCSFGTGECVDAEKARPDGWACDTNEYIGVCRVGKCELQKGSDGTALPGKEIFVTTTQGSDLGKHISGIYTRTKQSSIGRPIYIKQAQGRRRYTFRHGVIYTNPTGQGFQATGNNWEILIGAENGVSMVYIDTLKTPNTLDISQLIDKQGLPWMSGTLANRRETVSVHSSNDVCETLQIVGVSSGDYQRFSNVYYHAGTHHGRPLYKSDPTTHTGNTAVFLGWKEFVDTDNQEFHIWEFSDQRPGTPGAKRFGILEDYAASPDLSAARSSLSTFSEASGDFTPIDRRQIKFSCRPPRPSHSTSYLLHSDVTTCPSASGRKMVAASGYTRGQCAEKCGEQGGCDTYELTRTGQCTVMTGPCGITGSGGSGGGTAVWRLGRGTCSKLVIKANEKSTTQPPHDGTWETRGYVHAGQPVYCRTPCNKGSSDHLFWDPRWPAWVVDTEDNMKGESTLKGKAFLDGSQSILEMQEETHAREWTSAKENIPHSSTTVTCTETMPPCRTGAGSNANAPTGSQCRFPFKNFQGGSTQFAQCTTERVGVKPADAPYALLTFHIVPLFVRMAHKQNLDSRCVLISDPGTLGAGAKTRLHTPKAVTYHEQPQYCRCMIGHSLGRIESRIKKFAPHCVCRYTSSELARFRTSQQSGLPWCATQVDASKHPTEFGFCEKCPVCSSDEASACAQDSAGPTITNFQVQASDTMSIFSKDLNMLFIDSGQSYIEIAFTASDPAGVCDSANPSSCVAVLTLAYTNENEQTKEQLFQVPGVSGTGVQTSVQFRMILRGGASSQIALPGSYRVISISTTDLKQNTRVVTKLGYVAEQNPLFIAQNQDTTKTTTTDPFAVPITVDRISITSRTTPYLATLSATTVATSIGPTGPPVCSKPDAAYCNPAKFSLDQCGGSAVFAKTLRQRCPKLCQVCVTSTKPPASTSRMAGQNPGVPDGNTSQASRDDDDGSTGVVAGVVAAVLVVSIGLIAGALYYRNRQDQYTPDTVQGLPLDGTLTGNDRHQTGRSVKSRSRVSLADVQSGIISSDGGNVQIQQRGVVYDIPRDTRRKTGIFCHSCTSQLVRCVFAAHAMRMAHAHD